MIRVGQVMQHSGADHQVEGAANLPDALDRELMQFEILQIVLALKIARVAKARVADVDRRDSSIGLAERIPRGLRRAAASDQDFLVSSRLLGGPDQMELGSATVRVLVEVAMFVQTRERGRIGHPFVEVADFVAAVHFGPPRISRRRHSAQTHLARLSGSLTRRLFAYCRARRLYPPVRRPANVPGAACGYPRGRPPDQAFPPWVCTIANTASRLNDAGF